MKYLLHTRGMTLLELMVAISVFIMVMAFVTDSVIALYKSIDASNGSARSVALARGAEDQIVRDLRQATYSDAGAFPIATMGSTTLSFYSNTNSDGFAEGITYQLVGTTLTKTVVQPSGNPSVYTGAGVVSTPATAIRNIDRGQNVFRYFDASGAEVTDAANVAKVRAVTITLIANSATSTPPADVIIENEAVLRNLISP